MISFYQVMQKHFRELHRSEIYLVSEHQIMLQRVRGRRAHCPYLPSEGSIQHHPRGRLRNALGESDLLVEGLRGASEETKSGYG